MKTLIGSVLGAWLLLASALSPVQAQPTYPYFNLTAVPGGVAIKAIGAGGAAQKSVCFSGTGIIEAPVQGTVLPTYVNGFSPNTPTDCVGTVTSYDDVGCMGTILAESSAGITSCVAPPTAPTGVLVSNVSPTAQKVSWDDTSVTASNYVVKFCDSTGGACSPNQIPPGGTLGPDETMYMHTGLEPNHNYTYVVCGKNTVGEVCSGPVALTTPMSNPPLVPGGLVLNALSRTEIKASWADNSDNEDNFLLNYCDATAVPACDPNVSHSIVLPANTTMHTIAGLTPGTDYKVDVCAQNTAGTACAGNQQATTDAVPPPTGLIATALNAGQIELSFTDPDPSEGFTFNVYSCMGPPGCTLAFHSNVPGSGNPAVLAVISGLNSNTEFSFAVTTVWNTFESAQSNTTSATTLSGGQALVQQSGQVLCYDASDNVVSCADASAIGQDGQTLAGVVWPSPRYILDDDRCRNGGSLGVYFLDTLTDLCYLVDPCTCGTGDWYDMVALGADTFDGSGTCNLDDGSSQGDWRVGQFFEAVSLLDFQNTGGMAAGEVGLPQELIDLLTTASTLASCWDQPFWTATTAFAGGPPAVGPPAGYPQAWQPGWESFGFGPLPSFKSTTAAPLLVKDAAPAP